MQKHHNLTCIKVHAVPVDFGFWYLNWYPGVKGQRKIAKQMHVYVLFILVTNKKIIQKHMNYRVHYHDWCWHAVTHW